MNHHLKVISALVLMGTPAFAEAPAIQRAARKVGTSAESDGEIERAFALIREGKTLEAERLAQTYADRVRTESQATSARYAQAMMNLATVRLAYHDYEHAIEALRVSCAVAPASDADKKSQLACLMNLGDVLTRMGKFDEAEKVLRSSLEQRATFYGKEHPGYAYGVEALAKVLLARGQARQAAQAAEEAYQVYLANRHEELPSVLLLRALTLKASKGLETPTLAPLAEYPDEVLESATSTVWSLLDLTSQGVGLAVLEELEGLVAARAGLKVAELQLLIRTTNFARASGEPRAAIRSTGVLLQRLEGSDNTSLRLNVMLGRALAQSDAGLPEDAEKTYRAALVLAEAQKDAAQLAEVKRNLGLMLSERGRVKEAEPLLASAVEQARLAKESTSLGETLTAWGIFLQHHQRPRPALPVLEEALKLLPAGSASGLIVRTHLKALNAHKECDCSNDMPAAMAEMVKAMVEAQLPPGFVKKLEIELSKNARPVVHLELSPSATTAERAQVEQLINHSMVRLQRDIREKNWSSRPTR